MHDDRVNEHAQYKQRPAAAAGVTFKTVFRAKPHKNTKFDDELHAAAASAGRGAAGALAIAACAPTHPQGCT